MKVQELAKKLKIDTGELIKKLKKIDKNIAGPTSTLDKKTVDLISEEYNAKNKKSEKVKQPAKKTKEPKETKKKAQGKTTKEDKTKKPEKKVKEPKKEIKPAKKAEPVTVPPKETKIVVPEKPVAIKKQEKTIEADRVKLAEEVKEEKRHSPEDRRQKAGDRRQVVSPKPAQPSLVKVPETSEATAEKKAEPIKSAEPVDVQEKFVKKVETIEAKEEKTKFAISFPVTVKSLSEIVRISPQKIINFLISKGIFAHINQNLDKNIVEVISKGLEFEFQEAASLEEQILEEQKKTEDKTKQVLRAPVVTLMGHVDHGKTSLLDYIRKSKITQGEKGGITQHIGAYEVFLEKGRITFLDTPGHEAFTAMRSRGSKITDLVILVVAADDGVMPQTIEAIDHAKAANVPVIVAINKSDLPTATPDKVKKQLAEHNLLAEDWGGKTVMVNVSAKTGDGVETLLEMVLLESELLELNANPFVHARGVVIEAKMSPGRGPLATILVQNGTLKIGDTIIAGLTYGKVKAMANDRGKRAEKALPSTAVEILGLSSVPNAGDTFFVVKDEQKAKILIEKIDERQKEKAFAATNRVSLETLYAHFKEGKIRELSIILKTDVKGSIEAIKQALEQIPSKEVKVKIIHTGVGNVNVSDAILAAASNAIIIGFNVKVDSKASENIEKENIDVKIYSIIYEAVSDVKAALEGMLEPYHKEIIRGKAKVQQVFKTAKIGKIAGCLVIKGNIVRQDLVRVKRNNEVLHTGNISSLRRFKDDVKEVREGMECGITVANFDNIREGDILETYIIEKVLRKL